MSKPTRLQLIVGAFLCVLLLWSCSDVQLNYGAPLSGFVNLNERNRNANNPNTQENVEQTQVPVPSPTPNDRGRGDSSGSNESRGQNSLPKNTTPLAVTEQKGGSTVAKMILRAIPGKVELSGFGSEQKILLLLQDAAGKNLDITQFEFIWESLHPNLISVDNTGTIRSKTTSGTYKVLVSLKNDPSIKAEVEVTISAPSSGGGGGGGGSGVAPAGGGGSGTVIGAVQVTALSLDQGSEGDSVTLTVSGFNPQTSAATVTFTGGAQATITNTTATTITVTVPQGANSGAITVSSAEGSANSAPFTVIPKDNVTVVVIFE